MHRLRSLCLVAPFLLGACSLLNAPSEISSGTTSTGGGGTGGSTGGDTGGTTTSGGTMSTGGTTTSMDACGDGKITGTEKCDDDNTKNGDGCSSTCQEEQGFTCTGEPSVCVPACGNGKIDPGEQCDDGGAVDMNPPAGDQDACTPTCQFKEFDIELGADNTINNEAPEVVFRKESVNGVDTPTFLVVWHSAILNKLMGRSYKFDGTYAKGSGSVEYGASTKPDPQGHALCTAGSNRSMLYWHDGTENTIWERKIESNGMLAASIVTTIPAPNPFPSCAAAADPTNTFIAATVGKMMGGPLYDIVVQPYSSFAAQNGPPIDIGDTLQPNRTAAWPLSAGFMVSWIADPANNGPLVAQQLDKDGKLMSGFFYTMTDPAVDPSAHEPAGAWLGQMDQFVFVYTRDSAPDMMGATHREVVFRLFSGPGTGSDPVIVATDTSAQSEPRVIVNPTNHKFLIVWTGGPPNGENTFFRVFAPDGTPAGMPVVANDNQVGRQTIPGAAVDPATGDVAVVWDNFIPNSGKPHKVSAKIFPFALE
ncbi:MAG: DUF4215 domain-containing protein [Polyangiaceae bacterium]